MPACSLSVTQQTCGSSPYTMRLLISSASASGPWVAMITFIMLTP